MSRVFITNLNYSNDYESIPATLGEHVYVTEGIVKWHPAQIVATFSRAFDRASAEDYLVLSGSTLVNVIAFHLWYEKFCSCQAFFWDNSRKQYTLHQI